MSLWSLKKPPVWHPNAVATPAGWADPVTGELLVTIDGLSTWKEPSGHSTLVKVSLDKGSYQLGDTMTFIVQYTDPIVVTGTPTVAILINGSSRTFSYSSGSSPTVKVNNAVVGVNPLYFTHTVISTDNATTGQVTIPSGTLALSGGTIKDFYGSSVNSPLTFAGSQIDPGIALVTVDGGATISSVAGISGAYVTAGHILPTVTFSKAVTVTGTPTFPLTLTTGGNKNAAYQSGSGTATLTFSYLVGSADRGPLTTGTTLSLSGGTIKDSNGTNSTLTFSAPNLTAVTVNGS